LTIFDPLGYLQRKESHMSEFDAYLMVDWSASSRPVTGTDSIWYCLMVRTGDG
jgi:hypothetical protein